MLSSDNFVAHIIFYAYPYMYLTLRLQEATLCWRHRQSKMRHWAAFRQIFDKYIHGGLCKLTQQTCLRHRFRLSSRCQLHVVVRCRVDGIMTLRICWMQKENTYRFTTIKMKPVIDWWGWVGRSIVTVWLAGAWDLTHGVRLGKIIKKHRLRSGLSPVY